MECVLVSERSAKFNPGSGTKKERQAASFSPLRARKKNRNARKHHVLSLTRRSIAVRISSLCQGAETARTDENRAGFGFRKGLFNRWFPRIARIQVPFVQPRPLGRQIARCHREISCIKAIRKH
jgi:hypothetical protein